MIRRPPMVALMIACSVISIHTYPTYAQKATSGPAVIVSPELQSVVEQLDRWTVEYCQSTGTGPSPRLAEDTTFVRRVYLDILGYIPSGPAAREFATTNHIDKRSALVEQLLGHPDASRRLATVLRRSWFPKTDVAPYRYLATPTEEWLTKQFEARRALSKIAYDLLSSNNRLVASSADMARTSVPLVLLEANGYQASEMTANVTKSFLGVDLECAQCHDHPFDHWSREEFWQVAAFFHKSTEPVLSLVIPDTERIAVARNIFQKDEPNLLEETTGSRDTSPAVGFVRWVAFHHDSPFARIVVEHLMWEYLGLTAEGSYDDATRMLFEKVATSLTRLLIDSQLDVRQLQAVIVGSQLYQLDTRCSQLQAIRLMDGEQLYDSLRMANGHELQRNDLATPGSLGQRERFTELLRPAERRQFSVTQILELMNGELARQQLAGSNNRLVQSLVLAPFIEDQQCVESVYWATLVREPDREELLLMLRLRDQSPDRREWLETLFWALINSAEFMTNH